MIRIVIAEDQGMLRGALGALLEMENGIEVAGQAENGEEALQLIEKLQPDICVMDIEMPIKSGLDAAEELKRNGSSCKVMIVTTFARPGYFERAVKAGAAAYLLKDGSIEELADAIRQVQAGRNVFAPELVIHSYTDENPLTEREKAVLKLAAEGLTAKEIAGELYLSPGTVRNYLSEIIQKLECKNRIEAVGVAEKKGWM